MPLLTLPARHQVQEMVTRRRGALLLAVLAAQLDAARGEQRAVRGGVGHLWAIVVTEHTNGLSNTQNAHLDQARVEVDLRGQRRYRDERGAPHTQDRGNSLVEEALRPRCQRALQCNTRQRNNHGRTHLVCGAPAFRVGRTYTYQTRSVCASHGHSIQGSVYTHHSRRPPAVSRRS